MSDKTIITVIVSTYNSPAYLERVLQAYSHQTQFPDELLIADDGSTAETAVLVANFAHSAPFAVHHIWHEDNGFRKAEIHNKAISAAKGNYIIFTDGDCIPHPKFVRDHIAAIKSGCFVIGKRMLVNKALSHNFRFKGILSAIIQCISGNLSGVHHLLRLPWLILSHKGLHGIRGCNMAMFRSDLLAINGFNQDTTGLAREDSELVARLFAYGLKRLDLPFAAMVFHLWHPENSRNNLGKNDQLLEETVTSGSFRCNNGIVKEQ